MAITTQFLTGFEHGFVGAAAIAGGGLFDTVTAGVSASTSSPRNGSYCCRIVAPANTVTRIIKNVTGAPTKVVARFAVKVSVRPSGTGVLATLANFNNGTINLQITETGTLRVVLAGNTVIGVAIDTTNWHLIELQFDTALPRTLNWKVDGVAQPERSDPASTAAITTFELGTYHTAQPGFTADYDDVIFGTWTNAATDWYGDGKVLAQLAGVDGTHATITSLSPGDAGTAYAGTPTTVNTMVDDPPGTLGWTATRSTTDNIALRTATVGAYASIGPAATAEAGQANAVRALMSYSSPATQANLAACDVRNSAGAVTALWGTTGGTGADYSESANQFKGGIVTPPAAGWTAAEVNAIRFRFGGCTAADISPVPTVQALMLEVDWVGAIVYTDSASGMVTASGSGVEVYIPPVIYTDSGAGTITASGAGVESWELKTPYDAVIDVDNPISHWKLGSTTVAVDRKAVRDLPALNGPIASVAGLAANNGADPANTLVRASLQAFGGADGANRGIPYNTATWSIEAWINPATVTGASFYIIHRGSQAQLFVESARLTLSAADATATFYNARSAASLLVAGVVAHVVGVYDGTDIIAYCNGVEVARTAMPSTRAIANSVPNISSSGSTVAFDGVIDEAAWYGTALSPARVLAHYNAGKPPGATYDDSGSGTVTASGSGVESWELLTPYDAVLDADSIVSHWKLGTATALDRRQTRNLSATNGPITSAAALVAGNADDPASLFVAASSQRFGGGSNTGAGVPYDTAAWSAEAWIKPLTFTAGVTVGVLFRQNSRGLGLNDGRPRITNLDAAAGFRNATASTQLVANTTYHLVGVFNGTELILYVNAVEVARTPCSGTTSDTIGIPVIGALGGGANPFDGTIDEVAWYGTALSPERVLAHYNAGKPSGVVYDDSDTGYITLAGTALEAYGVGYAGVVLADLPNGYWRLADLTDSSGHGHTLTQTGTVTDFTSLIASEIVISPTTDRVRAFDGESDIIVAPEPDFWGTLPYTLVAVVRRAIYPDWQGILSIAPSASGAGPYLVWEFTDDATGGIEIVYDVGRGYHAFSTDVKYGTTDWQLVALSVNPAFDIGAGLLSFHQFGGISWLHDAQDTLTGSWEIREPLNWTGVPDMELRFGNWNSIFNFFEGDFAMVALLIGSALSASGVESLAGGDRSDYISAGFDHLWEFNQTHATGVVRDHIGTLDAIAPTGTMVVPSTAPPSSLYNLGSVEVTTESSKRFQVDFTLDGLNHAHNALLTHGSAFTVEAWVRPAFVGAFYAAMQKHSDWQLGLLASGEFFCIFEDTVGWWPVDGETVAEAGETYHIVGTWDGVNSRLYVNGVEEGSMRFGPATGDPITHSNPFAIGANVGYHTGWWGAVDEAAVYPSILSPEQVEAHYLAGAPLDLVAPVPTIVSVDVTKISSVSGKDVATVDFIANENFVEYELRRVSSAADARAAGNQVEAAVVSSRSSHTIIITDDELVAAAAVEGENLLKLFVKDAAGNWST